MLGRARIGVAGEDLCVSEWNAGVEGVGDCGVAQRVWADVTWDGRGLRDPGDHPVDVATVDRVAGERSQDQVSGDPLATTGFQDS